MLLTLFPKNLWWVTDIVVKLNVTKKFMEKPKVNMTITLRQNVEVKKTKEIFHIVELIKDGMNLKMSILMPLFVKRNTYLFIFFRVISWPWEITFVPLWIVLCISLVGVLYTIIFAGILLRMTDINAEQRRTSTNSALGIVLIV